MTLILKNEEHKMNHKSYILSLNGLLPCSCPPRSKVVKVIPAIVSSSDAEK